MKRTQSSRLQLAFVAYLSLILMIFLIRVGLSPLEIIPASLAAFLMRRLVVPHWTILAKAWEGQRYRRLSEHPLAKSALKRVVCLCVAFICVVATFETVKACLHHDANVNDSSNPALISEPLGFFKYVDEMSWDWFVGRLAKFFGSARSIASHLLLMTFCVVGSVIVLPPLKKQGENPVAEKEAC